MTRTHRLGRWLRREGRELIAVGVVTLALVIALQPMDGADYLVYIVAFLLFSRIFRRWQRREHAERAEQHADQAGP